MSRKIDLKDRDKTFKGTSLIGSAGGPVALVESAEGKITRIRPYDYTTWKDFDKLTPWKIEARGSSFGPPDRTTYSFIAQGYKKRVYSKNRILYPMKRVDWDPKGDRHPENRGKSKYERISWDEAAQLIADELLRVKEKYGMSCVLSEADMHGEGKHVSPCHGAMNRLLSLLGGYTVQMRNEDSWEGWYWGSKHVWGSEPVGEMMPASNLYPDICENADMCLFWGCDPETTPLGIDGLMASRLCYFLSEIGIKSIYVDPACNYGAVVHADKWIPVLPNTDAALHLAIAYMWLTEGTYDKEYVETHAVGYQEFFDYVLGKEDGVPKTPAWASEKCGVPSYTIKALARYWGKKVVSILHGNGGPGIRGPYATEPARLESILLGMQGLGKPGVHQAKVLEWSLWSPTYPLPYQSDKSYRFPVRGEILRPVGSPDPNRFGLDARSWKIPEVVEVLKPMEIAPQQSIPKCNIHEAILNGKTDWWGLYSFCGPREEQWVHYQFPNPGCSKIHMIWTDSPCMTTCWNDGYRFVRALQSEDIECVVAQHPWLENDCYLADIILPVITKFEMPDIAEDTHSGMYPSLYLEDEACPPVGEACSDFDAVARVAEKLGQDYYDAYTCKLSAEEVIKRFYKCAPISDEIPFEEFEKDNILVLPQKPDIKSVKPGLRQFYEDPASMPLTTPTGKLEFTSTGLKEHFPDDPERPLYPKWIEKGEYHDERLSSERAKDYPLLCMSNHGRWRMHAQCDDITWTREVETMKIRAKDGYQYEPCWLNPVTAKERGIEPNDIVKVYNERGVVLCGAYITERVMPGVAYIDHGARFDPIDVNGLDRGGAINLITPTKITSKHSTGMVVSGFLVEVKKVTDQEMNEWKEKYPESFERKIDEACGVCLDGWMIEK